MFYFSGYKWCDSIRSIRNIEVLVAKDLQVRLNIDKKINKEDNYYVKKINIESKDIRNFNFISENDFNHFLFLMKRLYYDITKKHLNVETIRD